MRSTEIWFDSAQLFRDQVWVLPANKLVSDSNMASVGKNEKSVNLPMLPLRRARHGKEYTQTPGSKIVNSYWTGVYLLCFQFYMKYMPLMFIDWK